MAICSMIMGGVFEKFPKLKVCFAHGGETLFVSAQTGLRKCHRQGDLEQHFLTVLEAKRLRL